MAKRIRNANLISDSDFYREVVTDSTLNKIEEKASRDKKTYGYKLEHNKFNEFTEKDWKYYFEGMYFKATNHRMVSNGKDLNMKAKSIFTSLVKNYKPLEIKAMIDFLFLADHDLQDDKLQITIFMLSKNWLATIYPNSILWREGKYKSKNNKRVREWTSPTNTEDDEEEIF